MYVAEEEQPTLYVVFPHVGIHGSVVVARGSKMIEMNWTSIPCDC